MNRLLITVLILTTSIGFSQDAEWNYLFDGASLDGWYKFKSDKMFSLDVGFRNDLLDKDLKTYQEILFKHPSRFIFLCTVHAFNYMYALYVHICIFTYIRLVS